MSYLKTTAMAAMAAMAAVVLLLVAAAAEAQETQTCISKLAACADSLNATKPTETCCSSIKEAVTTELACLCNVYNTPGLLESFGVTLAQALHLTEACNVPGNKCNTTLSPQPQPPSAVPGSDHNGAKTMAWTGFSTLCLLFVSMLFY